MLHFLCANFDAEEGARDHQQIEIILDLNNEFPCAADHIDQCFPRFHIS
jgi:hypothetical protein